MQINYYNIDTNLAPDVIQFLDIWLSTQVLLHIHSQWLTGHVAWFNSFRCMTQLMTALSTLLIQWFVLAWINEHAHLPNKSRLFTPMTVSWESQAPGANWCHPDELFMHAHYACTYLMIHACMLVAWSISTDFWDGFSGCKSIWLVPSESQTKERSRTSGQTPEWIRASRKY